MAGRFLDINIQNLDKVQQRFVKLPAKIDHEGKSLGYNLARLYASELKKATSIFQFPRPDLANRIRAHRWKEREWIVRMPIRGLYVAKGRRPGRKAPPYSREIKRWARAAGMTPGHLVYLIHRYGTHKKDFITMGIERARARQKSMVAETAKKMVR